MDDAGAITMPNLGFTRDDGTYLAQVSADLDIAKSKLRDIASGAKEEDVDIVRAIAIKSGVAASSLMDPKHFHRAVENGDLSPAPFSHYGGEFRLVSAGQVLNTALTEEAFDHLQRRPLMLNPHEEAFGLGDTLFGTTFFVPRQNIQEVRFQADVEVPPHGIQHPEFIHWLSPYCESCAPSRYLSRLKANRCDEATDLQDPIENGMARLTLRGGERLYIPLNEDSLTTFKILEIMGLEDESFLRLPLDEEDLEFIDVSLGSIAFIEMPTEAWIRTCNGWNGD